MEIKFQTIGEDVASDAEAFIRLCNDPGVDDAVLLEFETTVEAYKNATIEEASARINQRYSTTGEMIGNLILANGKEVGLAVTSIADFRMDVSQTQTPGINTSLWIIDGFRRAGIGEQALHHITARAESATKDLSMPKWNSRKIWTGIRHDNAASKRMCQKEGYIYSHPFVGDEETHGLYLYRPNGAQQLVDRDILQNPNE